MSERQVDKYVEFEDYAAAVVHEAWLKIIAAEDPRIFRAASLMLFDVANNDRSLEANQLASVAEEHELEPEDIQKVLNFHARILSSGY